MQTDDFDFSLPPDLVAQTPAPKRDHSRLLVLTKLTSSIEHCKFSAVKRFLRAGDVLILNNSRVIRARLRGSNPLTGGAFEILLLEENATNDWWAMLRPGKRARPQTRINFQDRNGKRTDIHATVTETNSEGHRRLQFDGTPDIATNLDQLGEIPLPPYIKRADQNADAIDSERYQTVYASTSGSVAAPTAGLHFTPELLDELRTLGVIIHHVTLHVGFGTFAPVKTENLSSHVMHEERYEVSRETAEAVNTAKRDGRRVIAVGTTSVRVLESAIDSAANEIRTGTGRTRIFIHPPYRFKIVDALLTNFHLPCSTLLMLVSAFAAPGETSGRETILSAYAEAVLERYRFFSYGDAMLIV